MNRVIAARSPEVLSLSQAFCSAAVGLGTGTTGGTSALGEVRPVGSAPIPGASLRTRLTPSIAGAAGVASLASCTRARSA
ncbi:hypothetical protein MPOCJGCO_4758 [Methylobacterium trifolii]|uniref:Uncharacterized protein n=1 Tax=Methylobacterium trifolii TaxID=1003092 RepID=A0ABQ4U8X9_9HYPH|nr:hypothetical protein MPOCJGCO_4758 [Methylobacterium trifolii]